MEDLSVEAATKAVEIDRALLREDEQPAIRLSLALDLEARGRVYRFAGRREQLEIVQVRLAALQGDKTLASNVEVSRPLQINQ